MGPYDRGLMELLWRWISAVVLIGAGMTAAIVTHDGWWVLGTVAAAGAVDRFVRWRFAADQT
jgi:hypothetical protein